MFKKKISMVLAFVMMFSLSVALTGCGSEPAKETAATTQTEQPAPAPEVDKAEIIKDAVETNYFAQLNDQSKNLIPPEKLNELIQANADALMIVDIRSAEEYAAGHIPGAINIPWFKVGENLDKFDAAKGKKIFISCKSGQTAGQVVGVLKTAGYNVVSVIGGFDGGWAKADPKLPVEK